jgi:hypothetical protein
MINKKMHIIDYILLVYSNIIKMSNKEKMLFELQLENMKCMKKISTTDEQKLYNLEYNYAKAIIKQYNVINKNAKFIICNGENVFEFLDIDNATKKSLELQEILFNSNENPWFIGQIININTGKGINDLSI